MLKKGLIIDKPLEISLYAQSTRASQIVQCLPFNYIILPKIKETVYENYIVNSNPKLEKPIQVNGKMYFGKIENEVPKLETVTFPSSMENNNIINLSIPIGFSIKPVFLYEDCVKIIASSQENIANNKIKYTFEFGRGNKRGYDELTFKIWWTGYSNASYQTPALRTSTYDTISNILVYESDNLQETNTSTKQFNVFDSYYGIKGLNLSFVASPNTISEEEKNLKIVLYPIKNNNLTINAWEQLEFFVKNELTGNIDLLKFEEATEKNGDVEISVRVAKILSTQQIFVKLKLGVEVGGQVSFMVKSDNKKVFQNVVLNTKRGVSNVEVNAFKNPTVNVVENQKSVLYLTNNNNLTRGVELKINPLFADVSCTIKANGNSFVVNDSLAKVGETNDGIYQFNVSVKKGFANESSSVTITFANGKQISVPVEVFGEMNLDDIKIKVNQTNSNVGYLNLNGSELSAISIKKGNSIPIKIENVNSFYNKIEYSFCDAKDNEIANFNMLSYKEVQALAYLKESNVVSKYYLESLQQIRTSNIGKSWVRATFTGFVLNLKTGEKEEIKGEKYFMVESYVAIESLMLSQNNVTLLPKDKLGFSNLEQSEKTVNIILNQGKTEPTYKKYFYYNGNGEKKYLTYDVNDNKNQITEDTIEIVFEGGNLIKFNPKAKTITAVAHTYGSNFYFMFGIVEFNGENAIEHTVPLSIKVVLPVMCNEIQLQNVDEEDGIYIDITKPHGNIFKIMAEVLPADAFNKKMIYTFIPTRPQDIGILQVNNEGLITLGNFGGTGKIVIVPEDQCKKNIDGTITVRDNVQNPIKKQIPITIADGLKRDTSIRITSLDEITNTQFHYTLISNVSVSVKYARDKLSMFGGGLYGKILGKSLVQEIKISENGSIFGTLKNGAVVMDLIISGTVIRDDKAESNGILANVNNGTIENVIIDLFQTTVAQKTVFAPSLISSTNAQSGVVGGIVGVNSGNIQNCVFSGSVYSETGSAGGIAGKNLGTINDCRVEIIKFDSVLKQNVDETTGQNYIKVKTVISNLIVGDKATGIITNSCAYNFAGKKYIEQYTLKDNNKPETFVNPITDLYSIKSVNKFNYVSKGIALSSVLNYKSIVSGNLITQSERAMLVQKNSVALTQIFGENVRVISQTNSVVSTNSSSLTINGIGSVKINIFYKYDFSVSKEADLMSVYSISNLLLKTGNSTIKDGTRITVKKGGFISIVSSLDSKVLLNNKIFNIETNKDEQIEFNSVLFSNQTPQVAKKVTKALGDCNLQFNNKSNFFESIETSLNLIRFEKNNNFAQILKENTTCKFIVKVFEGADSVTSDTSNLTISPSTSGTFTATIISDISADLLTDNKEDLSIKILNDKSEDNTGWFNINKHVVAVQSNNKYINTFSVSIEVNQNKKAHNFNDVEFLIVLEPTSLNTVSAKIKLNVLTQKITNVLMSHYPSISGNNYSSVQSNVLSPSRSGLLEVNLLPTYANFDYVTLTSETISGNKVSFRPQANTVNGFMDKNIADYTYVSGGVQILAEKIDKQSLLGSMFFRTSIPSTVMANTSFAIYFRAYNNLNKMLYEEVYYIIAQYVAEAKITLNNQTNDIVIAEGTQNNLEIFVPNNQKFNTGDVTLSVSDSRNVSIGDWKKIVNLQTGYTTYSTTVYVAGDDNEKTLKQLTITATVESMINGIIENKKTILNVFIVDFTLNSAGHKISNGGVESNDFSGFVGKEKLLNFAFSANYNPSTSLNDFNKFLNEQKYVVEELINEKQYKYVLNYEEKSQTEIEVLKNSFFTNLYIVTTQNNSTLRTQISSYFNTQTKTSSNADWNADFKFDAKTKQITVVGKNTGTMNLLLDIPVLMPNGIVSHIEFEFNLTILVYSDEDMPRQIYNATDFFNIAKQSTVDDYILMNDIVLSNLVPQETKNIKSFDGNNKTIHILSYELNNLVHEYALFKEVLSTTMLKNVTVNVHYLSTLALDTSKIKDIKVAGLAITNNGIITNCQVVSYATSKINNIFLSDPGIKVSYSSNDIKSETAGFVHTNNKNITNSRVGGKDLTIIENKNEIGSKITQSAFKISANGDMAGFVYANTGTISSSGFDGGSLINNDTNSITSKTSGFCVLNSGKVTTSYAQGLHANILELHATLCQISSNGFVSGFVFENKSSIQDCYSNIKLTSPSQQVGKSGAGFVLKNSADGIIQRSFSASLISGRKTTQMNFCGVNETTGFTNNFGIIENSYFYDINSQALNNTTQNDGSIELEFNSGVCMIDEGTELQKESYYGLSFTNFKNETSGIWQMTDQGPQLVAKNVETISHRTETSTSTTDKPAFDYNINYEYGTKHNPIIISSATEFNQAFGTSNRSVIKQYYMQGEKPTGFACGYYRLVADIDFSQTQNIGQVNVSSSNLSLSGVLDGNAFTISNFSLSASEKNINSYGLFQSIDGTQKTDKSGGKIFNLNIKIGRRDPNIGTGVLSGITAGSVKYVGALAGKLISGLISNINVSSIQNDVPVEIMGKNVVGGVVGVVQGTSFANNISSTNINVKTTYSLPSNFSTGGVFFERKDKEFEETNATISIAGGVFGVVDRYEDITDYNAYADEKTIGDIIYGLKTFGLSSVRAGVVGGVVGFISSNTIINDACFSASLIATKEGAYSQKLTASTNGFAGGIAGICEGVLIQVRSEHCTILQTKIENKISQINDGTNVERGNLTLFGSTDQEPQSPKAIGGLVGFANGAKIFRSYSKLNVVNGSAKYAGGIIGEANSQAQQVFLNEVYFFGDVLCGPTINAQKQKTGNMAGGIIGFGNGSFNFNKVNSFAYFGSINSVNQSLYIIEDGNIATNLHALIGMENITFTYLGGSKESIFAIKEFNIASKTINLSNMLVAEVKDIPNIKILAKDYNNFKVYFEHVDWSLDYWKRNNQNFFMDINFRLYSGVILIEKMADVRLLNQFPNGNFVVTNLIDMQGFSNPKFSVDTFNGSIRGKNAECGFINFKLNNPIFRKMDGATIQNLTFSMNGEIALKTPAYLVESASDCTFRNLKFEKIKITSKNEENLSIMVQQVIGGTVNFVNINFVGCSITSENPNYLTNAGFIFACTKSLNNNIGSKEINITYPKICKDSYIKINGETNNDGITQTPTYCVGMIYGTSEFKTDITGGENAIVNGNISVKGNAKTNSVIAGGLFGRQQTTKVTVKALNVNVKLNISDSIETANIGGVAGETANLDFDSLGTVFGETSEATATNLNMGGIVGKINGDSTFKNVNSRHNIIAKVKGGSNMGGIVGCSNLTKLTLDTVFVDGNITVKTEQPTNEICVNIGGLVGIVDVLTATNATWGGQILIGGKDNEKPRVSLNAGGIVGKVNVESALTNILAYGDIKNSTTVSKNELVAEVLHKALNIGGLVADATDKTVKVTGKNFVLVTIENKTGTYNSEESSISATVAKGNVKIDTASGLYFCSKLNLAPSSYGESLGYQEIVKDLEFTIKNILSQVLDKCTETEKQQNKLPEGHKLNPKIYDSENLITNESFKNGTDTDKSIARKYHIVNNDAKLNNNNVNNCFIVGEILTTDQKGKTIQDGATIICDNQSTPFEKINEQSVLSGIAIKYDNKYAYSFNISSGFATQNDGIIYACNVYSGSAINQESISIAQSDKTCRIAGKTDDTQTPIGGFVSRNLGFIYQSFSSINIILRNKNTANAGAFAGENTGIIESCYSTGAVESTGIHNAFADGKTKLCYSVSPVNFAGTASVFGKEAISCFYDQVAVQTGSSLTENALKNFGDFSVNYNGGQPTTTVESSYIPNMAQNKHLNYGYPYFNALGNYMQIKTDDTINYQTFFQIPNLSKFAQVEKSASLNFSLVSNLCGKNCTWTSINIFSGTLFGNNKTLSNFTLGSGIFATIEGKGKVTNLKIFNTVLNIAPKTDFYPVGLLVDSLFGEVNNIEVSNILISNHKDNANLICVGGVAGTVTGTVKNCYGTTNSPAFTYNKSTVKGIQFDATTDSNVVEIKVGGIVGVANGSISECYNKQDIFVKGNTKTSAGGIAGGGNYEHNEGKGLTINSCFNDGKVVAVCNSAASVNALSLEEEKNLIKATGSTGIEAILKVAYASGIIAIGGVVENCYNTGTIIADSKLTKVGEPIENKLPLFTTIYYQKYYKFAVASGIANSALIKNSQNINSVKDRYDLIGNKMEGNVLGGYAIQKPIKISKYGDLFYNVEPEHYQPMRCIELTLNEENNTWKGSWEQKALLKWGPFDMWWKNEGELTYYDMYGGDDRLINALYKQPSPKPGQKVIYGFYIGNFNNNDFSQSAGGIFYNSIGFNVVGPIQSSTTTDSTSTTGSTSTTDSTPNAETLMTTGSTLNAATLRDIVVEEAYDKENNKNFVKDYYLNKNKFNKSDMGPIETSFKQTFNQYDKDLSTKPTEFEWYKNINPVSKYFEVNGSTDRVKINSLEDLNLWQKISNNLNETTKLNVFGEIPPYTQTMKNSEILSKNFEITKDIICRDGWTPINELKSHLYGNNNTISGLSVPLFKKINGNNAGVSDLIIKNSDISETADITADTNVGMLANSAENATIENVQVNGKINVKLSENINAGGIVGTATNINAGGIVGTATKTKITDCSFKQSESEFSNIIVDGAVCNVGGIVGTLTDSTISGCQNSANTNIFAYGTSGVNAGGIVGSLSSSTVGGNFANNATIVAVGGGETKSAGIFADIKVASQFSGTSKNNGKVFAQTTSKTSNASAFGIACDKITGNSATSSSNAKVVAGVKSPMILTDWLASVQLTTLNNLLSKDYAKILLAPPAKAVAYLTCNNGPKTDGSVDANSTMQTQESTLTTLTLENGIESLNESNFTPTFNGYVYSQNFAQIFEYNKQKYMENQEINGDKKIENRRATLVFSTRQIKQNESSYIMECADEHFALLIEDGVLILQKIGVVSYNITTSTKTPAELEGLKSTAKPNDQFNVDSTNFQNVNYTLNDKKIEANLKDATELNPLKISLKMFLIKQKLFADVFGESNTLVLYNKTDTNNQQNLIVKLEKTENKLEIPKEVVGDIANVQVGNLYTYMVNGVETSFNMLQTDKGNLVKSVEYNDEKITQGDENYRKITKTTATYDSATGEIISTVVEIKYGKMGGASYKETKSDKLSITTVDLFETGLNYDNGEITNTANEKNIKYTYKTTFYTIKVSYEKDSSATTPTWNFTEEVYFDNGAIARVTYTTIENKEEPSLYSGVRDLWFRPPNTYAQNINFTLLQV
ncbi:MAG: hypothetical protein RR140_00505 [Clostridia bacterium]